MDREVDCYFQHQAAVAKWAELLNRSFHVQCGSIQAVLNVLPPTWIEVGRKLEWLVWTTRPLFQPFCET